MKSLDKHDKLIESLNKNIDDLILDWIDTLLLKDNDGNLYTEETLKDSLKAYYSDIDDWSF